MVKKARYYRITLSSRSISHEAMRWQSFFCDSTYLVPNNTEMFYLKELSQLPNFRVNLIFIFSKIDSRVN